MQHPDICIAGAGVIGLSIALELHRRGARVLILERAVPLGEASTAAAGMLAAQDPENPAPLRPLADLSLRLYPEYLACIERLSGIHVPFQTVSTLQGVHGQAASAALDPKSLSNLLPQLTPGDLSFIALDEHSLDPRQLAAALLAAVRATSIQVMSHTPLQAVHASAGSMSIDTPDGAIVATTFIDCTGAWAASHPPLCPLAIRPIKGQMLSVSLPPELNLVVRTPHIYIVPRLKGVSTGRAVIGATVESAGFDKAVHSEDIAALHASAAKLLPQLSSQAILESWSGLRPATFDGLPLLGPLPDHPRHLLATGHFRNGILLTPATACVMAQLIAGEATSIDLRAFSPSRTLSIAQPDRYSPISE